MCMFDSGACRRADSLRHFVSTFFREVLSPFLTTAAACTNCRYHPPLLARVDAYFSVLGKAVDAGIYSKLRVYAGAPRTARTGGAVSV